MELPWSQGSQGDLVKKFAEAVELEYFKKNSTPTPPKTAQIQSLLLYLKKFKNITLTNRTHQKLLIEYLMQYVELVMCFLSNHEEFEFRKQKHYAFKYLRVVPEVIKGTDFKSFFIKEATVKVMDLFTLGDFNLISKKALIGMYNEIAGESEKHVRVETAKHIMYCMYKLLDCLSTYGDYVLQSDIMEMVFRIFGNQIRNNKEITYDLLPGSGDLGKALTTDISVHEFDVDVRKWLNKFNQDSPYIFSIACKKVMYGNLLCPPPQELDTLWVDFDLKERTLSFYYEDSTAELWNHLIVISKDVKKVEIKRPLGANESTVSIHLLKPCISQQSQHQEYFDRAEQLLKLVIGNEERDKINKLVTTVLPQVFGDTFSHTSAKIADKPRNVYKPLAIKISRGRSSISDVSSITSINKSKSDTTSTVEAKFINAIPDLKISAPLKSGSIISASESNCNETFTEEVKLSTPKMDGKPSLSGSIENITDLTRFSNRSDLTSGHVSIISSNNSDIFPSSRSTSPFNLKRDEPKVQDNIITSSHGEDDIASSRIEILSGRCSGRSVDYRSLVCEQIGFNPLEVFSSSPVKISRQKDISSELYMSAASLSEEEQVKEETNRGEKKFIDLPKISIGKVEEESLEEEFETASENFAKMYVEKNKRLNKDEHISQSRGFEKTQETLGKKVSEFRNFVTDILNVDNSDKEEQVPSRTKKNEVYASDDKDIKCSSMLRAQAKNKDFVCVEQVHMDADYDSEVETLAEIRRKLLLNCNKTSISKPLDINKELSSNEIKTKSTIPNIIKEIPVGIKNDYDTKKNDAETEINDFFTDDIFDAVTQKNEDILASEKVLAVQDSEELFSRPIQENLIAEEKSETRDLSLVVNVGVSQFSESEQRVEKEILKQSSNETNLNVEKLELNKKEKCDILESTKVSNLEKDIDNLKSGKKLLEENKENVVDLTSEGEEDNVERVAEFVEKTKIVKEVTDKKNFKKFSRKKHFSVSTGVLDEVNPPEVPKKTKTTTEDKLNLNIDQQNQILKNLNVVEEKPKIIKKKPRTLIKTGKKRFDLEEVERAQTTQDDKTLNKNELNEGHDEIKGSDEKLEARISDEDQMEKVDETDKSKEQNAIQETRSNEFQEETEENKVISEQEIPETIQNLPLVENMKQLAVVLTQMDIGTNDESSTSSSPLDLAPEINFENVDYIDAFNQLKRMDEERRSANLIPEKGVPAGLDSQKSIENQTIMPLGANESNSHLEENPPEINIENVDYNDVFIKSEAAKPEESFILKKPARPLLASQASQEERNSIQLKKQTVVVNVDEQSKENVNNEIAAEVGLPEVQLTKNKISNILKKGKKGKAKKNVKKTVNDNKIQQKITSQANLDILADGTEVNKTDKTNLIQDNNKIEFNVEASNVTIDKNKVVNRDELNEGNAKEQGNMDTFIRSDKIDVRNEEKELAIDFPLGDIRYPEKEQKSDVAGDVKIIEEPSNEIHVNASDEIQKKIPEFTSVPHKEPNKANLVLEMPQNSKAIFKVTPDTSPEVMPHRTITTTAQVHVSSDHVSVDHKGKIVCKESLSEEFRNLEQELYHLYKDKSDSQKRKITRNVDEFVEEEESTLKRTRKDEEIKQPVPEEFDNILEEKNKSRMNTTVGSRSRKLYVPGNLSYLDELPDITKQTTPDLDETPIPVPKGTKLPKKKQALLKQKEKTVNKSKTVGDKSKRKTRSPKEPAKTESKTRGKRTKRKDFGFSTTDFVSLDEAFNRASRGLGRHENFAFEYDNSRYGGFNTTLHQPMDIAVRSAPQQSSSDESPPVRRLSKRHDKKVSPELPKFIRESQSPPTLDYSFPDLEIEPFNKNVGGQPKINILQDIVIKPKRPSTELTNPNIKRKKLNEEILENVPLPTLIDDGFERTIKTTTDQEKEKIEAEAYLEEMFKLLKFVMILLERRHDPDSLQKLRNFFSIMKQHFYE